MCAPDFRGTVLYPLAALSAVYPDLYERERVKYAGREAVLRFVVPNLNVTWGETVNLSALNPALLLAERRRLGVPFSNLLTRHVLRIPLERLAGHPAIAYTSTVHWANSAPDDPTAPTEPPLADFFPFDASSHREPEHVPIRHTEYLMRQRDRREYALGFVFIPHVLVAGPIDISGLVPVSLSDA
jgi:hypothetical protein